MSKKVKELTDMQQVWLFVMVMAEAAKAKSGEDLVIEKKFFRSLSGVPKLQKFHNELIEDLVKKQYLNLSGGVFYSLSDKARNYAEKQINSAISHSWIARSIMYIPKSAQTDKTA